MALYSAGALDNRNAGSVRIKGERVRARSLLTGVSVLHSTPLIKAQIAFTKP